jgi:ABC-type dipeptide/oligopeptide/nickel transport system permease subunit
MSLPFRIAPPKILIVLNAIGDGLRDALDPWMKR